MRKREEVIQERNMGFIYGEGTVAAGTNPELEIDMTFVSS
jgi:hypothetical protein